MTRRIAMGFIVLLCMALVVGSVGCGSSKPNPEQTVMDFWKTVQKGDYQAAKTYLSAGISSSTLDEIGSAEVWQTQLFEKVMESITMKTVSNTVNGDNATVKVEFTLPDMDVVGDGIDEVIESSMSAVTDPLQIDMEELSRTLLAKLPDIIKSAPMQQKELELSLVWEDGAWKINSDPFDEIQSPM